MASALISPVDFATGTFNTFIAEVYTHDSNP